MASRCGEIGTGPGTNCRQLVEAVVQESAGDIMINLNTKAQRETGIGPTKNLVGFQRGVASEIWVKSRSDSPMIAMNQHKSRK